MTKELALPHYEALLAEYEKAKSEARQNGEPFPKNAYNRFYRLTNPEKVAETNRKYKEKAREKILAYGRKYAMEYRKKNREKIKQYKKVYDKTYSQEHKEEKAIYDKEYRLKNAATIRIKRRKYKQNRRQVDVDYRLQHQLRSRFYYAMKGKKESSALIDVGCTIKQLKLHLESQFQLGMSWNNWAYRGWHIDHIIPLASFNLMNSGERERAFHFTNLQPLWAKENMCKSNKYE